MRARLIVIALGCAVAVVPAWARAQSRSLSPSVPLVEYVSILDRLAAAVAQLDERHPERVSTVLANVPGEWQVTSADRTWTMSAAWVRGNLDTWRRKPDAATRTAIVARLRTARSQAASYLTPSPGVAAARETLTAILARPEFRGIDGPTWLNRLLESVLRWVVDLLGRVLGSSTLPTITNVVVYTLIGLAVAVVALWMLRALGRSATDDETLLDLHTAAPKPWSAWLLDARAASTNGEWRQAIRLAYWCGIVYLEARGAWRPDPSRTPREYVRVLAATSDHGPALRSLTGLLERVWYGTDPADAARFDEALAHLKTLGCPLP